MSATSVFLMYHELELAGRPLCSSEPGYVRYVLTVEQFRRDMSTIEQLGLKGMNVSQALQFSHASIAITVDDGCETDLIAVAPLLKSFGFSATFYVIAGFLGKPGFLSPSQLQELSSLGFEIGCHSMTHAFLTELNDRELRREIADSKITLEQIIGKSVAHFSCPGGRYNSRVSLAAQEAGYGTLAHSVPRANASNCDPFSLGRVAMTRDFSREAFAKLCRGENLWKLKMKAGLLTEARRVLGNPTYERIRAILLKI
jgi:peptidoglycan/xylan/chitin deacetylase (PgdA/CDA1 family)